MVALVTALIIFSNPPAALQQPEPKRVILSVETLTLQPVSHQAEIVTYGTVQAQNQGALVSQISGVIIQLGDNTQPGAFFQKGELLFKLDDRDYRSSLKMAKAALYTAQAKLIEEQARSLQAEKDWQRMGSDREPNALVLRKPYLKAAEAGVLDAEARLEKAQLDLERTNIFAPYAGRVLDKHVDIGQFVNVGSPLIEIHASDRLEVRLPLNNRQLQLIDLGSAGPGSGSSTEPVRVTIETLHESHGFPGWQGRIIRSEAQVDSKNQQLIAVAEINDSRTRPIAIGEFVKSTIYGRQFDQVFVIPAHTLYSNDQVLLLTDGKIVRRKVSVIQRGTERSIVNGSLTAGEELIITPLGSVVSGTQARHISEESQKPQKSKNTPGKNKKPLMDPEKVSVKGARSNA